jgi:Trk K+ transport system NAD-binding subunit
MQEGGDAVIAVFRGERTHLPRPDLRLQTGDRMLVIVAPERWDDLRRRLVPIGRKA